MEQSEGRAAMGSGMQWLVAFLLLTVVSAAAGLLSSSHLLSTAQRAADGHPDAPERSAASAYGASVRFRKIAPVITNLAAPSGAWIRMEGSVVTDQLNEEEASILVEIGRAHV